ncbi:MAG: hypothetical protein FJX75_12355 [Armatimonadetes bacterium]|nr:hypothetical protein [Armatimonadota bacterium]
MNRLAWELRRRVAVPRMAAYARSLYDLRADGGLRFAIDCDRANRPLIAQTPGAVERPPVESLGLKTNAEYFAYLRSSRPPPNLAAAAHDLLAGLYEEAVGDTENLEAFLASMDAHTTDPGVRGARLWFEAHIRTRRAKALAAVRRSDEARRQLERAEVCIRQVPGIEPMYTHDASPHIESSARESIAAVWEMLDEPAREAAVLDPAPTREDILRFLESSRQGWAKAAASGVQVDPRHLEPVDSAKIVYPNDHVFRLWAAGMEAGLLESPQPSADMRERATEALRSVRVSWFGPWEIVKERCLAVAYEVLGDRKRALDGWQRHILSLMAMYEPDRSPLFDRAWAQVERLGGRRWA